MLKSQKSQKSQKEVPDSNQTNYLLNLTSFQQTKKRQNPVIERVKRHSLPPGHCLPDGTELEKAINDARKNKDNKFLTLDEAKSEVRTFMENRSRSFTGSESEVRRESFKPESHENELDKETTTSSLIL